MTDEVIRHLSLGSKGLYMLNSEKFLTLFATIEDWFRKQVSADKSIRFSTLVELVAEKNSSVCRQYQFDLKKFADLRNAIVHGGRTDGHVIAEPNERAVNDFKRICDALLKPPAVIPQFQKKVQTLRCHDHIGQAVADMWAGSFSQLPILSDDGKVFALLTSKTVVRWLASELNNDLVSLSETKIEAVLEHTEDSKNYCLLPRSATLQNALSKFEDFTARGKDLDAVLITQDGKEEQSLLGILTVYDLPKILEQLGLRRVSIA